MLDEDDERILKVLKKITDSLSLTHLSRTKTFLLSVLQNLQFSSSICTIAISTVFAISKSVARTTSREYKNIGGKLLNLISRRRTFFSKFVCLPFFSVSTPLFSSSPHLDHFSAFDIDICYIEEERGLLLQKLWYSDVQRWAGELLLSVYRATHTAVWAQEIEGTKIVI